MVPAKLRSDMPIRLKAMLCMLMATVLVVGMVPITVPAYAADGEKPTSVMLKIGTDANRIDVAKSVATLDSNKGTTELAFEVNDAYSKLPDGSKQRSIALVDSSGNQNEIATSYSNEVRFTIDKLSAGKKLVLITLAKSSGNAFTKRYEHPLNVRLVDAKKAETGAKTSTTGVGISEDGGTWSFSNGLQYTFKNTGFSFLDNTTMSLGALRLPVKYKHEPDGTTIAGINCSPEDKTFYQAVKNGNVWQKYTTEKMAKMTAEMDKGFSGKKFGRWGGKAFDWTVCGFMEFNTKNPEAPRALNLIISMGVKADGHAQYLCFTGTITFTIGGKAVLQGKLTPGKGVEGKFGLGAYAGLELYIGLGLQYVASVGGYGSGRIDVDFQILPETYLDSVKLSGEMGAKAKLFGFTIFSWTILKGEKSLYKHAASQPNSNTKKTAGTQSLITQESPPLNADGTATSPYTVSADTAYPVASRAYLNREPVLAAGGKSALMAGGQAELSTQGTQTAKSIGTNIYGETEVVCATTNSGPVIVYVADASQVTDYTGGQRTDENRSVLVYKRQKADGSWTEPKVIDTSSSHGSFADYSPSVITDGTNCYVAWLAADSAINPNETIGNVGKKLDVKMAAIADNDAVTVETVLEESDTTTTMPASPKAVKVGNDLYVGWYTNQTSGSQGEVIGLNGTHDVRLYKKGASSWEQAKNVTTGSGAITSFDAGIFDGKATCVWSFDSGFESQQNETPLNGIETLDTSSVFALASDSEAALPIAGKATNAQFSSVDGASVLTYAKRNSPTGGSSPYISIMRKSSAADAGVIALDGARVNLPTPYYTLTGDLGANRKGNVSFLVTGNGSSDIQSLVTTGAGSGDWTSVVQATLDKDVVTDYCATYSTNGLPLFIYTTETAASVASDALSTQEDPGATMRQTTEDSLRHVSVIDADYDEFLVKAGQDMAITVYFGNDGMLDIPGGVDVYILDKSNHQSPILVGSTSEALSIDGTGDITFNYHLPPSSLFTQALDITVCAVPKGMSVTNSSIEAAKAAGIAQTISFGAPALELEADQQIVDGQESIVATVENKGIAATGGKLVFTDANSGDELISMEVPSLGEGESFSYTYDAPNGYFENDGIRDIVIEVDSGDNNDGYALMNTEFVSAWEVVPDPGSGVNASSSGSTVPKTGDTENMLWLLLALVAVMAVSASTTLYLKRRES